MRGGNYAYKLTVSFATHEGQRTARRRSPSGSAAASAVPASPTRTINTHFLKSFYVYLGSRSTFYLLHVYIFTCT